MNKANPTASIGVPFSVIQQPPITVRRKSPYSQALELQDLLMKDAREATLKPVSRAIVARAWRDLEDMKRRIRGKADPKPVDVAQAVEAKRRAKQQSAQFSEPTES
jgi:hypothetical protein